MDPAVLRAILGEEATDDPELHGGYELDAGQLAAVVAAFAVPFDPAPLSSVSVDIRLCRNHSITSVPYLVHTNFELPLLLEGRKKLARMGEAYPPITFEGEKRFDHWVVEGVLHREEFVEPFEPPTKRYQGLRTVYYTPRGEEWRIPAMQLIWQAARRTGWNEYFERLVGMLFGYEDWQNDWSIERGLQRGGFGGASVCCAVTADGLSWLEMAGFRALPPCAKSHLAVIDYDERDPAAILAFLLEEPDSVALVRFVVPLWRARKLLPPSPKATRWRVPSERIPELNRLLRNEIVIATRREIQS